MSKLKLLILVANLIFVRLALGEDQQRDVVTETAAIQTQEGSIFDGISSLDFSARQHQDSIHLAPAGDNNSTTPAGKDELPVEGKRTNRKGKMHRRPAKERSSGSNQLVASLISQLENLDIKRILADSLRQTLTSSGGNKRQSNGQQQQQRGAQNQTAAKERVNVSALSAEAGNIMSITRQLVKLARNQMIGGEFGSAPAWLGSPFMPSMLSAAASHLMATESDLSTAAGFKSEWFWFVVPTAIVIGAGVIVVPLIAAWAVSHLMNQNTFTVSAGRRKRRDVSDQSTDYQTPFLNSDLLKMLDIHRLLDGAPNILANKLSRLHQALDSVGSM